MPAERVITKRVVSVVVMPAGTIDCHLDPAHEGHADCPVSPHAGKAFVARYTAFAPVGEEARGVSISEYLTNDTGEWLENPEGVRIPDDCWHEVRP